MGKIFKGSLRKPQRQRQRQRRETKGLMSRTIAEHVRCKSLYISLPSSAKQQREMTNSMLTGEREPRRLIFKIFISDLSMCPRFSFVIALTEITM